MNLLNIVDEMIIGGGMAFTFKKMVDQMAIGNSLFDESGSTIIAKIMEKAKEKNVTIHLPTDFVAGDAFAADAHIKEVSQEEGIPDGWMGLDIGPQSGAHFAQVILGAKTIVWNGPMGVFEFDAFGTSLIFLEYQS